MQPTEKEQVVNELFKPVIRKFRRCRTIIKGLDDLWQADLAEFRSYSESNRGHNYALVVIDCFSKYLWTRPLKTKTATEVCAAMTDVLENSDGRVPKHLQTDQGTEFFNRQFGTLMRKYKITHYNTYSVIKASMAERVIRTLKNKLYKAFTLHGSHNWVDGLLDRVTVEYNETKHSKTGLKPSSINGRNEAKVLRKSYAHLKKIEKPKFNVGDIVRVSKCKHVFEKGYTPNWTTELFKISKVISNSNPPTYLLDDLKGDPIKGRFYGEELQITKQPDIYLVEKVLRRRGSRLYVKWLGMPASENGWITTGDVAA